MDEVTTRRHAENFKYSAKDTDIKTFLLPLNVNYNNLLEENKEARRYMVIICRRHWR